MPHGTRPRPDPQDHYAILGVPADATPSQITHAYRILVRALHPDTATGNTASSARFTAVTSAYAVLHDPVRRAAYDQARTGASAHSRAEAQTQWPTEATVIGPPQPDYAGESPLRVGPPRVGPLPRRKR